MGVLKYFFTSIPYLGFFTAALLAWYFYVKARNNERMALIEKGVDLSKFYSVQTRKYFPWLGIGVVITGISSGVMLFILLLVLFPGNDLFNDLAYFGVVLFGALFGGISMIIVHFIYKSRKE